LSLDSVGPHFVAPAAQRGQGLGSRGQNDAANSYKLVGIDELMADLDVALGDSAGKMPLKCMIAHPFWTDGLVHTEAKGEEESKRFFEKIKGPGTRGQGPEDRVSMREASSRVVNQPPVRRVRVWVHATEVVDTRWNPWQKRYMPAVGHRKFSSGFVTSWEQNSRNWLRRTDVSQNLQNWESEYLIEGRDWRTDWMGDGTYVVFTAIEVQEKRGRHWVRLPWCCKLGIQDVVVVAGGKEISGQASELEFERLGARDQGLGVSPIAGDRPWFGKVGYLDAEGEIVIVEGWPLVGKEIKVWDLEKLLPPGKLVGKPMLRANATELLETVTGDEKGVVATAKNIFGVDLVGIDGVLIEVKVPIGRTSVLGCSFRAGSALMLHLCLKGSGIRAGP
jgi:hypothetical protein